LLLPIKEKEYAVWVLFNGITSTPKFLKITVSFKVEWERAMDVGMGKACRKNGGKIKISDNILLLCLMNKFYRVNAPLINCDTKPKQKQPAAK
jgi:hypothetical protein